MSRVGSVCVLLAALLLCGCAAAREPAPEGVTSLTAPPAEETPEPLDTDPEEAVSEEADEALPEETDEEGKPLSPEQIAALLAGADWEGVYSAAGCNAVLKEKNGDLITLIFDWEDGTCFSSYARVEDGWVICERETCGIYLSLNADGTVLTVETDGAFPLLDRNPEGEYTKTDADENEYYAGIDVDKLPATLSETVIDGKLVTVYVDPAGRFSCVLPSIFASAPSALQPESGICLVSGDERAKVSVYTTDRPDVTAESLRSESEELYPGAETEIVDGCVRIIWEYEDGYFDSWKDVMLMKPSGQSVIVVDFTYRADDAKQLDGYAEVLYISDN